MAKRRPTSPVLAQIESTSNAAISEEQPVLKTQHLELDGNNRRSNSDLLSLEVDVPLSRVTESRNIRSPQPTSKDYAAYRRFRTTCEQLVEELKKIDDYLDDGKVTVEGLEVIVEVEQLLENLYDCGWGQGERLKRVVVAIQSQVNNLEWTSQHVAFLKESARFLRVRYLIDEATVEACYEMMKTHGLDPFRGTVSDSQVLRKYRIEEVKEP